MDRGRARDLDLEEVHGALQVAEAVFAEVDEVEVVAHEFFDERECTRSARRARPTSRGRRG